VKAKAELRRRGQRRPDQEPQAQATGQPQTATEWWREFESNVEAVERAIARQHQAAIDVGEPWPALRTPEAAPLPAPSLDHAPGDRAARLDELLAGAEQAAQRLVAQKAERHASSQYAARIDRKAQTGLEARQQAEARDEAELEPGA
jgi:hypothetical protein